MRITLALAGFALLLVAVPWWSGGAAISGFEHVDAAIEEAGRGRVRSSTVVERGILRSFATTTLGAPAPEDANAGAPEDANAGAPEDANAGAPEDANAGAPEDANAGAPEDANAGALEHTIVIRHTLFHGPLPIGELLHGRLPRGLVRALVETEVIVPSLDPERVVATLTTKIDWSGLTHVSLDAPAYERDIPRIHWSGATGSLVSAEPDFQRVSGFIEMPRLELGMGQHEATVENVFIEVDAEPSSIEGLALGGGSVSVERIHVSAPERGFELKGLRWEQQTSLEADSQTYASTFRSTLDALVLDEDSHGPAVFEMVLRNLDLKALGELQALANAPADDDLAAEAASALALQQMEQILSRSPELEITQLRFEAPGGTLQATGRARIDGESPSLATGPLGALSALSVENELFVPTRLCHRMIDGMLADRLDAPQPSATHLSIEAAVLRTEWLERMLSAGYVQRTPDGYRIRIEFGAAGLRLNGLPVDPAAVAPTQLRS